MKNWRLRTGLTIFVMILVTFDVGNATANIRLNVETTTRMLNIEQIYTKQANLSPNESLLPARSTIFSDKIEPQLISQLTEKDSNFETIANSDSIYNILIYFKQGKTSHEIIAQLQQLDSHVLILKTYQYISCIYMAISHDTLMNLVQNPQFMQNIDYITTNRKIKVYPTESHQIETQSGPKPLFSLDNWWLEAIGMSGVTYTGKGVKIGIMDTGLTIHPDFYQNGNPSASRIIKAINFAQEDGIVDPNYVFDDYGHGTHVTGIACGNGIHSDLKYRGVAPNAEIVNIRALNSTGEAEEDEIISGIEWCIENEIDVINMSFGYEGPVVWDALNLAIKSAVEHGVVVVAAAGNSGPYFFTASNPGSGIYSIAVGATDINDRVISFSSIGPTDTGQISPDICAPGVNIIATDAYKSVIHLEKEYLDDFIGEKSNFAYVSLSGTSMASPMVTGAVAVLLEAFPSASPESIRNALIMGARETYRPSPEGKTISQGAGIINVSASLEYLRSIEQVRQDVNAQIMLFPRVMPYGPYDLIRFPGDHQLFNMSIYSGKAGIFELHLPAIQGIELTAPVTAINFTGAGYSSLELTCKIRNDAIPQKIFDYINITNAETNEILDQIPINLTIAYPNGKIYFESYHGLTDMYPQRYLDIVQIDLYHAMYDLMQLNYQLDYRMQNWTPQYDANKDAELITPKALEGTQILVLTTPRIPFTAQEILDIKEYYDQGGSILFLGTKTETICVNSINEIFTALESGINISQTSLFNAYDLGFRTLNLGENMLDLNKSNPILDGVENYAFGTGCSFNITQNAYNISSIKANLVAVGVDQSSDGKGKIIALGSYQTFMSSIYNDPVLYANHSKFLQNIVEYLCPVRDDIIEINILPRNITESEINLVINHYNPQTQERIVGSISAGYSHPILGNFQIDLLQSGVGQVHNSTTFSSNMVSNYPWKITATSGTITAARKIFYYPNEVNGYTNITFSDRIIDRSLNITHFQLNFTEGNYSALAYMAINPLSYFSNKPSEEAIFSVNNTFGGNFIPKDLKGSGIGWLYCETNQSWGGVAYRDLNPDRYDFGVKNEAPVLKAALSYFSNVRLDQTQSENSVSILRVPIGGIFPVSIIASDLEDEQSELQVSCSLLQILIYNQYPNPIFASIVPFSLLRYNSSMEAFTGFVYIPSQMAFNLKGKLQYRSIESDLNTYFTLCWISVMDHEGATSSFILVFALEQNSGNQSNYLPIIGLAVILGLSVVVLHKKSKSSKGMICPRCGLYTNEKTIQCIYCGFEFGPMQ
jgi:subtilisin family serine protease